MTAKSTTTTTVTAKQVSTGLAKAKEVTADEDRALRMRYGATVDPRTPLEQKAASGSEASDEMALIEMQLLKAYRAHLGVKSKTVAVAKPAPSSSRAKDKIVRALRKKR